MLSCARSFHVLTYASILLFVVAIVFVILAMVAVGVSESQNMWTDVFRIVKAFSSDALLAVAILCLVASIVVASCPGSMPQARKWLFLVFGLGLCVSVAASVMGFVTSYHAKSWSGVAYPAEPDEVTIATGFNQMSCANRLCRAPAAKFTSWFPNASSPRANNSAQDQRLCESMAAQDNTFQSYKTSCKACAEKDLDKYAAIWTWVDSQCPMNATTDAFCGQVVLSTASNSSIVLSPYLKCRKALLNEWMYYAKRVAGGGTILAIAASIFLVVLCRSPNSTSRQPCPRERSEYYIPHV
ncbi:hypothetical protein LEN26_019790 [Aphanomyces euteiches]|nr:hypothetical protein LEN26_019790 [Aphanomyces euteiches]KAH9128147.1 hypothetical protein AeMF1_001657 [Aphanomyces euteiches]KAH9182838.1 hypothetical protein AeNC1_015186 [Aphanomyces euteiches]